VFPGAVPPPPPITGPAAAPSTPPSTPPPIPPPIPPSVALSIEPSATATGETILQQCLGTQDRAQRFYDSQMLDHLNARMREFVARQQMMFLATSDARGNCDNTFRSGPAGFVQVLGERVLAWPEYRGNGVMASLGNLVENPHVGLLFVDFFDDGVGLHVNGRATMVPDDVMRAEHAGLPVDPAPGRRAEQWVRTEVEEAYIHCAKFIPRLRRTPIEDRNGGPRPKKSDYFIAGAG
jgi:predicted pyridoxine 5'-phosphate oxidase superfamily flavin-nucleotide-binding protein